MHIDDYIKKCQNAYAARIEKAEREMDANDPRWAEFWDFTHERLERDLARRGLKLK